MNTRIVLALTLALLGACRTPSPAEPEPLRQPERALELSRKAADLVPTELPLAESLLDEALALDPYCGPAHNNLGVVYLKTGRLDAAQEAFEQARRLLPGHPDPLFNLTVVEAYRSGAPVAQPNPKGKLPEVARD